jgi:hypothetical protein
MDLSSLLYLTGTTGFFTSRAFIPAFFTAFFLRYGQHVPLLGGVDFIQTTGAEPTWFTNNYTILLLGGLALLEVGATKIPEAQEALDGVHKYAKTGLAAVTAMGVLNSRDLSFIEQTITQAGVLDMVVSGTVAVAVFFFNSIRSGIMELFAMSDPDDDVGIRTLISWFEDLWSSFGLFLLIIYPFVILTMIGIVLGLLFAMRKYAEHKETRSKVSCPTCHELIFACASSCPSCHTQQKNLKDIGFFGQTIDRPAQPGSEHEIRLVSKRRCPKCATRVTERKLPQGCPTCRNTILGNTSNQEAYIAKVRSRLPKVLIVTLALGFIPVLGLIPGVIYYRMQLIAPFRVYIPGGRGFALKWLLKLVFLIMIILQVVPVLGAFMVPTMALLSYSLYASYFSSMLAE